MPEGDEAGKTMQDSGATEKWTSLPAAGVRVGWARTHNAISPQRITTSAELPRKVTRSIMPVPVLVPLFDGLFRSKNSTYSGRKNNDAGNPSRQLDATPGDKSAQRRNPGGPIKTDWPHLWRLSS